jgi:hypothetical protein
MKYMAWQSFSQSVIFQAAAEANTSRQVKIVFFPFDARKVGRYYLQFNLTRSEIKSDHDHTMRTHTNILTLSVTFFDGYPYIATDREREVRI